MASNRVGVGLFFAFACKCQLPLVLAKLCSKRGWTSARSKKRPMPVRAGPMPSNMWSKSISETRYAKMPRAMMPRHEAPSAAKRVMQQIQLTKLLPFQIHVCFVSVRPSCQYESRSAQELASGTFGRTQPAANAKRDLPRPQVKRVVGKYAPRNRRMCRIVAKGLMHARDTTTVLWGDTPHPPVTCQSLSKPPAKQREAPNDGHDNHPRPQGSCSLVKNLWRFPLQHLEIHGGSAKYGWY